VLVQWGLERLPGGPVADSQEAAEVVVEGALEVEHQAAPRAVAVVVHQGDLLGSLQAVQARQVAHRVVPGPGAPLRPEADPVVSHELARSSGSPDQMGYPLSPMVLVRILVPAFWGDSAGVESLDPLLVGTAGGAVATMGLPPVEATPLTRWSQLWQKGRNLEPLVVVSPSGSMFVGLAGG
jgi:hypothetical protein